MDKMFNELDEWFSGDGKEMLEWLNDAKDFINDNWEYYGRGGNDFMCDKCKVADMMRCGKEQWLKEYSYMTAEEYDATIDAVLNALQMNGYFDEYSIDEYEQIEREWAESEVD